MNLISSIVTFVKLDEEQKGIPPLIQLLTSLKSAQNGIQRAAAIGQFEVNIVAAEVNVGQDILNDANTTLLAELQADLAKASAASTTAAP
jgi:hypothetical protein